MAKAKQKTQMCPVQVGCDGVLMHPGRQMCSHCERAIKRRASSIPPKGEPEKRRKPEVT